jgi:hypothetical protein
MSAQILKVKKSNVKIIWNCNTTIKNILKSKHLNAVAIDQFSKMEVKGYFIYFDRNNKLLKIGNKLSFTKKTTRSVKIKAVFYPVDKKNYKSETFIKKKFVKQITTLKSDLASIKQITTLKSDFNNVHLPKINIIINIL